VTKFFTEHWQDSIVKVCNISQSKSISEDGQDQNFLNAPRTCWQWKARGVLLTFWQRTQKRIHWYATVVVLPLLSLSWWSHVYTRLTKSYRFTLLFYTWGNVLFLLINVLSCDLDCLSCIFSWHARIEYVWLYNYLPCYKQTCSTTYMLEGQRMSPRRLAGAVVVLKQVDWYNWYCFEWVVVEMRWRLVQDVSSWCLQPQ